MSLRLLLIRHAKAGDAAIDRDRPLAARGRAEAERMGRWVATGGFAPAEALCSDARRTRETLDLMLPSWEPKPAVSHVAALYAAGPEAILRLLARSESDAVAVVGHNPGMGVLAARLAREAPDHPRWGDFPTCSAAVLSFEAESWEGVGEGQGEVLAFGTPHDDAPVGREP